MALDVDMRSVDSRIKTHLIQEVRKNWRIRRAKWFGPIMYVESNEGADDLKKLERLLEFAGARSFFCMADWPTCGDEECCGLTFLYVADWRTGWERFVDLVLDVQHGPKSSMWRREAR